MPPKGFKKPEQTRCATCGERLPGIVLRDVLRELVRLRSELAEQRPGDEDPGRWARLRMLRVGGVLDILIEEVGVYCHGHGAKPGPKPKPAGDPSFPADPETPRPKRRRLRAVQSGGGDD